MCGHEERRSHRTWYQNSQRGFCFCCDLAISPFRIFMEKEKALSILVCTQPSHILFVTIFVYTTRAVSSKFLHLLCKNENILRAAEGDEVHTDRVQVMHALDT